ncbi:hypothetical protein [Dickeya dadantii]|uniref:hypothetical protein n=1 Tax=Dickeya dadantii TaxID=204038 RepID=UPI001CC74CD0|nr:hypothetical protein [Dickeya dadantii]UAY95998.1 hypothetical protein KTF62_19840 [Dickeya dadantii]
MKSSPADALSPSGLHARSFSFSVRSTPCHHQSDTERYGQGELPYTDFQANLIINHLLIIKRYD